MREILLNSIAKSWYYSI